SPSPPANSTADASEPADNAFTRANDEEYRKIIRKRERRWARRHYQDDQNTAAAVAQDSKSTSNQPSTSSQAAAQSLSPPALQAQPQPTQPQVKTADDGPANVDNTDTGKASRKHDRSWSRRYYARDDQRRWRDDDRPRPVEAGELPRDAPQPLFGMS